MNETLGKHERNAGVDLLRCLMMFGIVVHHCCCHTPLSKTLSAGLLFLFTVPAVDGFVAISGWYGMRFSFRKLFSLLGQVAFCSVLLSALSLFCARMGLIEAPLLSPGAGWFTQCYVALFCLSPFLAVPLREDGKGFATPVAIVLGLATGAWLLHALGLGGVPGMGPFSLATFVLVYVLSGLFARMTGQGVVWPVWIRLVAFGIVSTAFIVLTSGRLPARDCLAVEIMGDHGYDSPFVILMAVVAVSLVVRLDLPMTVRRLVRFLAPSMFSVYLFHDAHAFGREAFVVRPIAFLMHQSALAHVPAAAIALAWAVVVFVSCVMIDVVLRRIPLRLIRRNWNG